MTVRQHQRILPLAIGPLAIGLGLAAVALGAGGCRGCANDHPYVPPATDAGAVAADAEAPDDEPAPPPSDAGLVEPALVLPPNTTSWQVGGATVAAGGQEIVLALGGDFDGDGRADALLVARPAQRTPGSPTGGLFFFRGGADSPPAAIATGPALGMSASCAPVARLERIGPRSAFAEIGSACAKGDGERALVVVRLGPPVPRVAFSARVLDPEAAPKLTVDVDPTDRDHDGIDDVLLRVTLDPGAPGTEGASRVSAKLAFFDRPAGASRDPEEPEASLRALAGQAERASKGKDPASAPRLVQQVRAVYRAICAEGGAPRLTGLAGGSAATCGTSKALEQAGVAEARAWAVQRDALRAVVAVDAAQLAPATKTAARTTELQKALAEVAPTVEPRSVRALSVPVDVPRDGRPTWSPLAFDEGKLLVRHGKFSLSQVDLESGEAEPSEMAAWPEDVLSPDGRSRWIEAYHACEGVALRASFAPVAEGEMREVTLPIAPRLGRTCSARRGEAASVVPVAWGAAGLEAIVAGQPVLVRPDFADARALPTFIPEIPPLGSPRSRGGQAFALATSAGVLVRSADRWRLVRAPELEPYSELRGCAIEDGAVRLACVRRRSPVLITLP